MTDFDYAARLRRLRDLMAHHSVDVVLLSVGPDLPYFTRYEAMETERLTMLVVRPQGDPVLLVPQLEAARVEPGPFEVLAWAETENPVAMVAAMLTSPKRVAIGDHTRSSFLVALQSHLDVEWMVASELTRELRMRKETAEIEALRAAAAAADRVLERLARDVHFEGRTERQLARDVIDMTVEEGHDSAEFWIVASGPNGASPHHEPGGRVITQGDAVVVDFGGRVRGYHSDVTRTFIVGQPSRKQVEVHAVVAEAQAATRAAVRAGVSCEDVDRAARDVVEAAGYGEKFIHRTGHGIGLEGHEHPYIVKGNDLPLEPGMTFSVEPGIYLPGRFGVRIEDIVVCTPDGAEVLNQADRGLLPVE